MTEINENYLASLIKLNALLETKVTEESKNDFLTFVRLMAPTLVSDWRMGRHIELISNKLKMLESGEIKRLMVFLPPRSSKSVICSKLFPAWYIGRNPEHERVNGRQIREVCITLRVLDPRSLVGAHT